MGTVVGAQFGEDVPDLAPAISSLTESRSAISLLALPSASATGWISASVRHHGGMFGKLEASGEYFPGMDVTNRFQQFLCKLSF